MSEGPPATDDTRREALLRDGFVVVPDVLEDNLRERLKIVTDAVVARQDAEHAKRHLSTGSMVPTTSDPAYAELITLPAALAALASLGYPEPHFSDGWVISKPGGGRRLFWHYDWFTWQDDASLRREPLQVSLMYYLDSTRRENGCLRVIPGSHAAHNPLHDELSAQRRELDAGNDRHRAEFSDRPDEVDVPVRAGDLLIADARLLHAGHPNDTDERRRLITLWYQPDLASLPERMQAQMAAKAQPVPADWPPAARDAAWRVRTRYGGSAEPYERAPYRRPPDPDHAVVGAS